MHDLSCKKMFLQSLLFFCSRSSLEEHTPPTQDCSVERLFQGSLLLLQQALHQLQWTCSAERFSFKALFSSMQQALISFLSFTGKVYLKGSLLFNTTSPRQLQWIAQRKGFSLKAFSSSMQQALISCSGLVQQKGFFFKALFSSMQQALHQQQWTC